MIAPILQYDESTQVLYCLLGDQNCLYLLRSSDHGRTWSDPLKICDTEDNLQWTMVKDSDTIYIHHNYSRYIISVNSIFPFMQVKA